jgi:SAM-dependent methyltransferase
MVHLVEKPLSEGELEYIECPVCSGTEHKRICTSKDYLYSQEEFTVVKCNRCKVMFTNPRIKEEKISQYYFEGYLPCEGRKQSGDGFARFGRRLMSLSPSPYSKILRLLNAIGARNVLEIGPGAGELLFFLKDNGFDVTGVEMSRPHVERIRHLGIRCYHGRLNDVKGNLRPGQYDAVIMCHVFEHFYDPMDVLEAVHIILNDRGIIYMVLPNIHSLEARLFGRYWRGLDLPRHIVHYDENSIRTTLAQRGYEIAFLKNELFPSSFLESIGFRLFKKGRMPRSIYYSLYYVSKMLAPIFMPLVGSGVMSLAAGRVRR